MPSKVETEPTTTVHVTIEHFLASAEGRQWTAEDTARVLRHIHAVEQTALAVGKMQGKR